MKNSKCLEYRVIVLGSSIAGLWAARVCTDYFDEVLLVEQDEISKDLTHRKGVPQDWQLHIMLSRGYDALNTYFPEAVEMLTNQGAISGDLGQILKWYNDGGYRPQCETGLRSIMMSRPLLENTIRQIVLKKESVKLLDKTKAIGFLREGNTVVGVQTNSGALYSHMVIDARSLASRLPAELERWGYEKPELEKVYVNVKYTSCLFPRPKDFKTLININTRAPDNSKHGTIQPIEGDRMILMVQGRSNDEPPRDVASLKAYTKALESRDIYQFVKDLEPLAEVQSYHIPYVRWIHYERMRRFPEGILPLGDSVCRLNPVYGQGMSSAAMQAQILERVLSKKLKRGIWKGYFRQVAKALKTPWELTVMEDFKFPETRGTPPKTSALLKKYFTKLNRVANQDPAVYKPFLKVLNMVSEPIILMKPNVVWRVIMSK